MKFIRVFAVALSVSMAFFNVHAVEQKAVASEQKIEIVNAWARPSAGKPNSAAYMEIHNKTAEPITITGAVSNVANATELHQSVEDRGVMKMHSVDKLVIPAHDVILLKPKGTHIMLMKLKDNLVEDQKVNITLTTDTAGSVTVEAIVKSQVSN